jgi:hypothetical protein
LAQHHARITAAGARVVGISVDSVGQNAAMVDKLRLPFPLLSDPGGEQVIKPYRVWHEGNPFAQPAIVVVTPDRRVAYREVGDDFVDRLGEDQLVEAITGLVLPPTTQDSPRPGQPAPGSRAVDLAWLPAYLRGGRLAVGALAGRVPEARAEADAMVAVYDRFLAALAAHRRNI